MRRPAFLLKGFSGQPVGQLMFLLKGHSGQPDITDVTLASDDQSIKTHKVILSACSP